MALDAAPEDFTDLADLVDAAEQAGWAPLYTHISELKTDNAHQEYYLTDVAALLVKAGERVVALETPDVAEVLGANTIAEMMDLDRELRARTRMSQSVFAAFLNTSVSTVQKWEIGEKKPSGPSLKLLNLIDKKGVDALV